MKNLISKDIIIAKKSIIIGMLVCAGLSISWGFSKEISAILNVISITIFIYICIQGSNGYDDLNKSYMLMASLPITRDDIVKSKYIQVILYLIIGEIQVTIINFIMKSLNIIHYNVMYINFITILISVIFILIYYSIYYPLYFKLGNSYVTYINQIIFVILILSPSVILKVLKKHSEINITKLLMMLNLKGAFIILLSAVILFMVSIKVGQRVYKQRELS